MSLGMLVHGLSVLVALVRRGVASAHHAAPGAREGPDRFSDPTTDH
jgi:hypothetical protein